MRKFIALLAVCLTALMLLTGCGCMGCGDSDRADDGVVDGSGSTNSTDGVVGGDDSNTADEVIDGADELMDGARNAVGDMFGGGTNGGSGSPGISGGTN